MKYYAQTKMQPFFLKEKGIYVILKNEKPKRWFYLNIIQSKSVFKQKTKMYIKVNSGRWALPAVKS